MECDECGLRLYYVGDVVGDGDTRRCPDCGTVWMVSMDAETEPYLVRVEDAKEPTHQIRSPEMVAASTRRGR